MTGKSVPARLPLFVALIVLLGASAVAAALNRYPFYVDTSFILLTLSVIASEVLAVKLPHGGTESISYPLFISILVLDGPAAAALAAILASVVADVKGRKPVMKVLFNAGQLGFAVALAGVAYSLVVGNLGPVPFGEQVLDQSSISQLMLGAVLFTAVVFVSNTTLVSAVISISERTAFFPTWLSSHSWQAATQFAMAPLGLALADMFSLYGILGLLVFAVPLAVSRGVFRSYMQLREAYADTVRGLVAAIEAKDSYTRGHSERVSVLSVMTARDMGWPTQEIETLELAALLHDLGKVGIGHSVLQKPGALDDAERSAVEEHPAIARDIISEVPFLQSVLPAVSHHHERYDGSGYAAGIRGDSIPLHARVLAVADSFDAMTSVRPYRPSLSVSEAEAELVRCAGSQFDPVVVRHFLRARREEA